MRYMLCFIFSVSILSAAGQDKFTLQGYIANQQDGWVYLSYMNKEGKYIKDSTAVSNNQFRFSGAITEPTMAYLNGKVSSRSMDDPNYTSLYIEPGNMEIHVAAGAFKQAIVSGSKTQLEYYGIQQQKNAIQKRWKIVMDTLHAVNTRSNFMYQELKNWVLTPYFNEMAEVDSLFMAKHPQSYVTAFLLRFKTRELPEDTLRMYFNRFPLKLQQSKVGKELLAEIEKKKIGIPGTVAKGFTAVDINGNKLSLADMKGKYVLIDFWASWCLPCRKLNPHLKDLYTKYKDKGLEILGVSDDDRNHEAWKKAVEKDDLPWKHVLRGLKYADGQFDKTNDISEGFNISSLPTHILIGPDGKIISRFGEGGEEHEMLDKRLASIFKF